MGGASGSLKRATMPSAVRRAGVDNVGNAGGVVAEFLVYEHYRARARGVNGHCFGLCGVPFFGIYLAAAYDVARDIAAGYAVNYTARTACHRRGAELDS